MDELTRRLLNLPEEIHRIIITKYKDKYLFDEITKKNENTLKILKNELSNISEIIENNQYKDFEDYKDFIDVCNINLFNRILQNNKYLKSIESHIPEYFVYLETCISRFSEYYFSLNYNERKIIKDKVLENTTFDYQYRNLYFQNLESYICDNKLYDIIDPDSSHSGASFAWCIMNILPILFGSHEQKLEFWIRLIKGHIYYV